MFRNIESLAGAGIRVLLAAGTVVYAVSSVLFGQTSFGIGLIVVILVELLYLFWALYWTYDTKLITAALRRPNQTQSGRIYEALNLAFSHVLIQFAVMYAFRLSELLTVYISAALIENAVIMYYGKKDIQETGIVYSELKELAVNGLVLPGLVCLLLLSRQSDIVPVSAASGSVFEIGILKLPVLFFLITFLQSGIGVLLHKGKEE